MSNPLIHIVDDDPAFSEALGFLLSSVGLDYQIYPNAQLFLDRYRESEAPSCILLDLCLPGPLDGLGLLPVLAQRAIHLPVVMLSGHGDVPQAVKALHHGALDFLSKPCDEQVLLERVQQALDSDQIRRQRSQRQHSLQECYAQLTAREREILALVVQGFSNRGIADHLGISAKTVELHRARVMEKMRADSLPDLVRMALQLGLLSDFVDAPDHQS